MGQVTVEIKDASLIYALDLRDIETLTKVIDKIVDSWDYSQELHDEYAKRIATVLKDKMKKERDRIRNYGGSIGFNLEFCEKEIKAGRKVDSSRLRYTSN